MHCIVNGRFSKRWVEFGQKGSITNRSFFLCLTKNLQAVSSNFLWLEQKMLSNEFTIISKKVVIAYLKKLHHARKLEPCDFIKIIFRNSLRIFYHFLVSTNKMLSKSTTFFGISIFSSHHQHFICYFLYKLFKDIHFYTMSNVIYVFVQSMLSLRVTPWFWLKIFVFLSKNFFHNCFKAM